MAKRKKLSDKDKEVQNYNNISINNSFQETEEETPLAINNFSEEKDEISVDEEMNDFEAFTNQEGMFDEAYDEDYDSIEEQEESIENAVENEVQAQNEIKKKGLNLPPSHGIRDPKKDKDPLEGEDIGLQEDSFLLSRKVSEEDLLVQNDLNDEMLLGSNESKADDLLQIFRKGKSSKNQPKLDTTYNIENNATEQKKITSRQILTNYHSSDSTARSNALNILQELKIDEEVIGQIDEDENAHENMDLIELIKNKL